jgi:hypothetical protein
VIAFCPAFAKCSADVSRADNRYFHPYLLFTSSWQRVDPSHK